MTKLRICALFFIAAWAVNTWAAGTNVYKCGSTYSQTPCEGAVAMQVDDARSKEQKSQSEASTVRQGKTANTMEKTRLKEEAQAIAQSKRTKSSEKSTAKTKADADSTGASKNSKSKNKEPELFLAKESPPSKKK